MTVGVVYRDRSEFSKSRANSRNQQTNKHEKNKSILNEKNTGEKQVFFESELLSRVCST